MVFDFFYFVRIAMAILLPFEFKPRSTHPSIQRPCGNEGSQ